METYRADSSGTDDDLPASYQNRVSRGPVSRCARSSEGVPFSKAPNEMETEIHRLEQEAYSTVLRAFKAQSDAITWEKEGLITELRKELRISNEEHRQLLNEVNADDIIHKIREWRQAGGFQSAVPSNAQIHGLHPSSTVSGARKRQKTSHFVPSQVAPQQTATSVQPSTVADYGASAGVKAKHPKSSNHYPSGNRKPAEAPKIDPLIGRKVFTRWPDDHNFYEAVISDYDPQKGKHALVYDINTEKESWEWVDLKEIASEDIQWEGEDPGISRGGRNRSGQGIKKLASHVAVIPSSGNGRGLSKNQSSKDYRSLQNSAQKKSGYIEIFHTETLLQEVERVLNANRPDPSEMDKAKKLLKEHEQSLLNAIATLADTSDGESEKEGHQGWNDHGQGRNWGVNYVTI